MADEYKNSNTEFPTSTHDEQPEVKDRGMFDFLKKKEEKKPEECQVEAMTSELGHVKVSSHDDHPEKKADYFHQEEKKEEEKPSILAQFHHKKEEDHPEKKADYFHQEEEKKEEKPSFLAPFHHKKDDYKKDDGSSSSSSSDEEVEENGEKIRRKKNKKGLKEKIKEKFGHDDTTVPIEKCEGELTTPPPYSAPPAYESQSTYPVYEEPEKKNLIEKIQDKLDHDELPGGAHHVDHPPPEAHSAAHVECSSTEPTEEKKGFLEKIKEKLPGGHKKSAAECTEAAAPAPPVVAPVVHEYSSTDAEHHDAAEHKEKKGILEKIKEKLPGYHKSEDEHKEKEKDKAEGHY